MIKNNILTKNNYNFFALIPRAFLGIGLYFLFSSFTAVPEFFAGLSYLTISGSLKMIFLKHQRNGQKYLMSLKYTEAIREFQNSYSYFNDKKWLDKYRSIIILSENKYTHREFALFNIAFCYIQLDDYAKVREVYLKVQNEFPSNELVDSMIKTLNSDESNKTAT